MPSNFYVAFRDWLDYHYPVRDEGVWNDIMMEDSEIDYESIGNGMHQHPHGIDHTEEINDSTDDMINQELE